MTFLLYLGKVMLCSGILLGYYWLFLRNKRFHHYNRFYLQATLLLSVLLPLIKIPVLYHSQSPVNQVVYQTLEVLTVDHGENEVKDAGPSLMARLFTLDNVIYILYVIGILALLFTLIKSLLYIRRISKHYPFERINGLKFFNTGEPGTPFSFFRSIFWNNELVFNSRDGQQIFRHELFHVQQKHSTDIMLTELVTALFWVNPFFHILKKELKAIHEFLADQYAISGSDRYDYAELLVLQTIKASYPPITNHFFQNHIKRRIAMITNNQSSRYSYRSRLMALPVLALVFCTIAFRVQKSAIENDKHITLAQKPLTIIIDAGHGGTDPGASSLNGKVKEKDLALQISQKIQQLASAYNVNVIMTRTDDNLPGGTTDIKDGLRARTAMANEIKPAMYVSIHVSSIGEPTPTDRTGFEIFVPNDTTQRVNQSKQLGSAVAGELSKLYAVNQTLKQRTDKNIWVLQQTPCPALLIECGFIDNEKDLAYFSNAGNQEAVAKKILEGIVKYNSKPATAIAPPASQTSAATFNDTTVDKLARFYRRNLWTPREALAQKGEEVVYFSVMVNKNGELNNFQSYEQAPAVASQLTKIIVIGYLDESMATATEKLSKDELIKRYQSVTKTASERKPDLSGCTPQTTPYFFEVHFRRDKKAQVSIAPLDRQMLLPNGFLWNKQGKC
jgi:N-acetylmuramoyl-L-alanine amidase